MKSMDTCSACHGRKVLRNGAGNPVLCPLCNGVGKTEPPYDRLPFFYVIDETITLAVSATNTNALSIEPRADFEWAWLIANSTGIFNTRLTDASGRTYQNAAVNNVNQWGTAQLPFPLVSPIVLSMRTALNYELNDDSGADNTIQLVLAGYELYPLS